MADTIQLPACSKCGQEDDHPRHIVLRVLDVRPLAPAGADEDTIARLESVYNTADHLDCCTCHNEPNVLAALGNAESCAAIVERAGGRKGDDLRAHLVENPRKLPQES